MKGLRGERLSGEFQKNVYEVISRKLKNRHPELSVVISVTGADIAPDLKTAKIYVSIFDTDTEKKERSFEIIKENAGFIRHEIAKTMPIRSVPVLSFILDESMEYGEHIDKLLKNLDVDKQK